MKNRLTKADLLLLFFCKPQVGERQQDNRGSGLPHLEKNRMGRAAHCSSASKIRDRKRSWQIISSTWKR